MCVYIRIFIHAYICCCLAKTYSIVTAVSCHVRSTHIHMCECICICMRVCVYTCVYIYIYMHVLMYVYMCCCLATMCSIATALSFNVRSTYTHVYIGRYTCVCAYVCVCIYTHIDKCIYMLPCGDDVFYCHCLVVPRALYIYTYVNI